MPKKRSWHHPYPRFVNPDGSETLAGEVLRLCAREEGMPTPYGGGTYNCEFDGSTQQYYGGWKLQHRRDMLWRLSQLGLVHELRTGPRGGKYWHTTPIGDAFARMVPEGKEKVLALITLLHG
jgi:hypothetical protein